MRRGTIAGVAAVLAGLAVAAAGGAEDLVTNGEFDFDTAGWVGPEGEPDWITIDHDSCGVDSGAARAENSSAEAQQNRLFWTCVLGLTAGAPYSLDGYLRIPSGQSRSGNVYLEIAYLDSTLDCQGNYTGFEATSVLPSTNPDVWIHKTLRNLTAPPGTHSAQISVLLYKEEAGGTLLANFDGIHLVAGNGYLFGDGFESDTLCRWSETEP